jgi:16S rRNA (adenine(1408)-N(1))-methyltransferase
LAKEHRHRFYIGIDANPKPLEKPSMKATRRPAKGGLPNAMFIQAAVEDLPEELSGIASEIYINFPWGSLLGSAASADTAFLNSIRRVAAAQCRLEITIGVDPERDRTELERLGLGRKLEPFAIIEGFAAAGLHLCVHRELKSGEWRDLRTTWAKRLQGHGRRVIHQFVFAVGGGDRRFTIPANDA